MNVSSDVARVPGWYGKLPTLGDFASRRLEADFIEPWDLWLGESLQAQRSAFGEGWLDAYLDTPPWRFVLSPGALRGVRPDVAFAGVLVPSVDRVGRHFPLTLVASLARLPDLAAEFDSLFAWLHRLEDTALDALQGDWTIDDLENALAELPPPGDEGSASFEDRLATMRRAVAAAVAHRGGFVDIAGVSSRADLAAVFASAPVAATQPRPPMRGLALWIADTPGRPQLLVSEGLPGIDEFVRMFAGGNGARSGVAARAAPGADVEDPLATLPQGLGAPVFASPGRPSSATTTCCRCSPARPPPGAAKSRHASCCPTTTSWRCSRSAAVRPRTVPRRASSSPSTTFSASSALPPKRLRPTRRPHRRRTTSLRCSAPTTACPASSDPPLRR